MRCNIGMVMCRQWQKYRVTLIFPWILQILPSSRWALWGLEEIAYRDTVQILGNQKTLSKVFVEKDVYMADHF